MAHDLSFVLVCKVKHIRVSRGRLILIEIGGLPF